mgnify:FL=1|jgi:hypothetical protein
MGAGVTPPQMDPEWSEVCEHCNGHGYLPKERNCANETCGKPFRWQDEDRPGRQRSRQNTIYCSLRCARNQARREYQRRQQSAKTEQRSVTP